MSPICREAHAQPANVRCITLYHIFAGRSRAIAVAAAAFGIRKFVLFKMHSCHRLPDLGQFLRRANTSVLDGGRRLVRN